MSPRLGLLRGVGVASTVFSFALVVWGAIVRINGAGMTCPDWPRCRGAWFPALDPKVMYEYYHRVGAALLTIIVIATFLAAWFARNDAPAAFKASWVSLGLIVAQIVAGAVTIVLQNDAPSVAVHLVLGFSTFVSLLMVTIIAYAEPAEHAHAGPGSRFKWLALGTTSLAFLAVFAGGWMAASNDGLACTALPLCGAVGGMTAAQQIHMAHRYVAYVTIAAALVTWFAGLRTPQLDPLARAASWVALGLAVLQGALGAATIVSGLEPVLRSLHEANAALLIASLVVLTYFAFRPRSVLA
ncbi:MAG TPA: COX15/CtaA family protein [Candidatus Eremiobacteraceae bacterium]|nr:COX15/CtaA family protein [Candidatus Eremiobacteraceae bacterium]